MVAGRKFSVLLSLMFPLVAACTGYLSLDGDATSRGGAERSTASDDNDGDRAEREGPCAETRSGPAPLRRLSRLEYHNTIEDVLGVDHSSDRLPGDQSIAGFRSNSQGSMSEQQVELYLDEAQKIADRATEQIDAVAPCDATGSVGAEEQCVEELLETKGRRLFRRELTDDEIDQYLGIFREARGKVDYAGAVSWVVHGLLVSPHFLYHNHRGVEVEEKPNVERLEGEALADRLAYTLWKTAPDEQLLEAAANGELASKEGLRAEAERLLADERARTGIAEFFAQWLAYGAVGSVDRDEETYPNFDDDLKQAMERETRSFIEHLFWERDASLEELLQADYSFLNARLAEFYGVEPPEGDGFHRVSLEETPRRGLLTQGSMLTSHARSNSTAVIYRGKFIRNRLLCQSIPPPPDDVQEELEKQMNSDQSSEKLANERLENSNCSGCHAKMDKIGRGLERFNSIGADLGPEEAHEGTFVAAGELNGSFESPHELGGELAESPQVRECVARNMLQYSLGRMAGEGDQCTLQETTEQFVRNDLSLRELLLRTVTSDSFRYVSSASTSCDSD